jgi:hypothetical protein
MKSTDVVVANQFATAVARGDFEPAHSLLTEATRQALPAAELRKQYTSMTDYGGGPATQVQVMQELSFWPGKQKDDVGWVYVAVSGDNFSEAVTVVVCREHGRELIRSVEWGRP